MNDNIDELIQKLNKQQFEGGESELGAVFNNMDDDTIKDKKEGFSNIDFNSRLTGHEINAIMVIDSLKNIGILPPEVNITRMKKRLSVSIDGKGRQEKVEIASASRGAELSGRGGGFLNSIKNLIGGGN